MKAKILIGFGIALIASGVLLGSLFLAHYQPTLPKISSLKSNLTTLPKAYVIQSGSMNPTLKLGSVVFILPPKLAPKTLSPIPAPMFVIGDIITYKLNKEIITHRIVGIQTQNNELAYQTKGDVNKTPDINPVSEGQVLGKAVFSLPYLGYLADFAKQPKGFILLVIVPATIIIYEESKAIKKELAKFLSKVKAILLKKRHFPEINFFSSDSGKGLPKSSIFIPIIGASLIFLAYSGSFFSDAETAAQNLFTAASDFSLPITPTPTPPITPTPPTPTPTPTIGPGNVVINEINWGGSNGDGNDEWVELLNTTTHDINLTGWVVENLGTGSGPGANIAIPSGTIPAGGYFLISQSDKAGSKINVDPDYITRSISLNNGGEQLKLTTNTAALIDTANDTGGWFAGSNSTPKKSMERKTPPGDGTISNNWQTATTHTNMDNSGPTDEFGTPKATND